MSPGEANSNNGGPRPEAYEVVTIVEGPNSTKSENTKRGLKADPSKLTCFLLKWNIND